MAVSHHGSFMRVEAQVYGPDANPLPESVAVKAFVSPADSDDPKDRKEIKLSARSRPCLGRLVQDGT